MICLIRFFIATKMKIFFPQIRFLLPLFTAFFVELLQFVARAQNAEFVSFQSFEFSNDNSSNSQWFTFAIANNKSMPVNVSLNGESNSAIVLSAQLCDNSRSSLSSNDSLRPNAILALTVHSDQFKSVLLRPDTLPLVDQCPPTNLSADQSVLLLFEVQSMVNGSRGTLAVRRTDAAEGAVAFTAEGVPNELAEENAEWLLTKGQQIVLPILGNCSAGHCSELAQFSAHMAIRQGSAELALVQECPLPMDGNNSGSSLAEKQTFLLLDSFQPGEYLSLLDIRFGENGTANATIKRRNHSEESMEILHCPPPSAAVEYNESASYGNIRLFVSSSSSQPSLVAFSQFRIFNAQHLTLATERPFLSIGHLFLFLLLLVVSFVLIGFFFALFLSRRFALQQRRENCENEQRNKEETTHLEMNRVGQSEHSSRPASTISKREEAEVKINAKALEERAIGGSKGDGWM